MWTVFGTRQAYCDGLPRRDFLKVGGLFASGLTLPQLLQGRAARAHDTTAGGQPRSAILIYLAGGPSHYETFDPKPHAPEGIRGPYSPIATNVPGTFICETFPRLAQIADKYSLIRSCAHDNPGHGGGNRYVNTGHKSASLEDELPHNFPVVGSIVAKVRGPMNNGISTFVRCPPANDGGPAFLGNAYRSFDVYSSGKPLGLDVSPSIPLPRMDKRRALRAELDRLPRQGEQQRMMDALDDLERQAYEMVSKPTAQKAFDLSQESQATRDRYGSHDAGKTFLLARRFVEAGVGLVSVRMGSWDHHGNAGGTVKSGAEANSPPLDQALTALITDLHERGLSDQVLVYCWGEFGRTPRINNFSGRDHWPQAMSVLMAGGGLKMGQVIGATDTKGERPIDRACSPTDVLATVYRQLGIDHKQVHYTSGNRPVPILPDGAPIAELI